MLKGSFKVDKGSFVKKGDVIAACGNSGRSPEPHVHFQIQNTPYIGSRTINYPISHYILKNKNGFQLKSFETPKTNDIISNIEKNESLFNAFHFIPGQKICFDIDLFGEKETVQWEVITDIYNYSYIYCDKTNSKAYFSNAGKIHYFTTFDGEHDSLLYYFYLSAYKVLMGFYKGLIIKDSYPLNFINKNFINIIQDFAAPFFIFMHSDYSMECNFIENYLDSDTMILHSETKVSIGKYVIKNLKFKIFIDNETIKKLEITKQ